MAEPLAVWAVEISAAQGVKTLDLQLEGINSSLQKIDLATKGTGNTIKNSMLTGAERVAVLGAGYGFLTSKVMGFVSAGLAGTAEGERLNLVMTRLNQSIASIFTPAIHAAIDKLNQLTNWFRNLSGNQQEQIRNMVGMGVAFLGVATIVPKLISAVVALSTAFKTAFTNHPVLMIISAIASLLVTTEQGRAAIGKMGAALLPLASIATSFAKALEPIAAMLNKIVDAAVTIIAPMLSIVAAIVDMIGPSILLGVVFYTLGVMAIPMLTSIWTSLTAATIATYGWATATGVLTGAVWGLNAALNVLKAHPIPYILGVFLMWGLLTHYHWSRYKVQGDTSSRTWAVLWGLHFAIAMGLLVAFGWPVCTTLGHRVRLMPDNITPQPPAVSLECKGKSPGHAA